ncbi:cell division protein FtsL [Diaphorobacter sp.]|uniref:cell division protein FtsL n=1 Tax=Diaphorobacter sp. TaxID=1934310 RepID=UPI003917D8AB
MRLNFLLLLAVMASAMYLVHSQYESRRLFTELDRAQAEARRLETEHQRLQVEKRAQATPLRVETMAREKLQMKSATPAITQYVADDGSPVPMVMASELPDPTSTQPGRRR